jgi:amino acid adenylation domain-containing protein
MTDTMLAACVGDMLTAAATEAGGSAAVSDENGTWTYAELEEASASAESWLRAAGVQTGDRVLVRLRNRREFVALFYGALRAGAAMVPINPNMRGFHLTSVISDARPRIAVTHPEDVEFVQSTARYVGTSVHSVTDVFAATPTESERITVTPDDLALLMYTSGSTSAPKAVVCPHRQVVFAAHAIAARLSYRSDDVVLTASPLSFDYGLYQILLATIARAELVLADTDAPVALMATLRSSKATVVPVVPSLGDMLARMAARGEPPSHVRMFTNTGAALTTPTIASLRRAYPMASIVPMYGITECKRVTILEPDGDLVKPGSVGPPLPGTRVLILDEDGTELPAGTVGEIVAAGPHVMAGYWQSEKLTAQRFRVHPTTGENLLHTGDFGHLDADGHLYFAGRRDDQFKRKGVRMSSIEIEAAAMDIDGVGAAALLTPDGKQDMVLVVTGRLTSEEVLTELSARLEPAKVPDECLVRTEIPLTANGKSDKKALAQEIRGAADGH